MHIRKAKPSDSQAVAVLHRRQIPWGQLSQLGGRFVAAFYETLMMSGRGFVFVAVDDEGIAGFASGVEAWRPFYLEFFRRHTAMAARALFQSLRGARWRRLLETTRYAGSRVLPAAELVAIALEPRARGGGVATALVRQVLTEFAARGIHTVRVTAGGENRAARQLYERAGFGLHSEAEIHPGETAAIYVIALNQAAAAPAEAVR